MFTSNLLLNTKIKTLISQMLQGGWWRLSHWRNG